MEFSQILFIIIALAAGGAIGYVARKIIAQKIFADIEQKASSVLSDAQNKSKEMQLQAKDRAISIIDTAKREEREIRVEIQNIQRRLEKREEMFDQKLLGLEDKKTKLEEKGKQIDDIKEQIQKVRDEEVVKLEKMSQLSRDDAKQLLLQSLEDDVKEEGAHRLQELEKMTTTEVETKARTILSTAIMRCAAPHTSETTTSIVTIPSEDMKGRIIGKEGRNIRAIEQLTGVEVIIDETPLTIIVSGFSAIRRQIAKRAIDKLITDGRIHPGRIEEMVEEAKRELAEEMRKAGEEALEEAGVGSVDPKLVQLLGRLKFRTSYGQNVLRHSLEVCHIAMLLAKEIGANLSVVRIGGLFHDIGKSVDHEVQGGHPEIGYNIMKKFGFADEIAYQCIGHHEDRPKSVEAMLVKAADAISGGRPGARKETYEQYVKRLTDLEQIANQFKGVEKTYAIQAGRELRVFVQPEAIDDLAAYKLAKDIAMKIEAELAYPGEIKVTIIRETRVIEYAR